MTPAATVEQLDRELSEHAAVAARALAAEQSTSAALQTALKASDFRVEDLTSELAAVRLELERARAELQWLRRAGIDLNAMMEHPLARGARTVGRTARKAARRPTGT